jgi:uncharacterized membrane protein
MTTHEAVRWSGAERRTGGERRITIMAWTPERRAGERRRGGVGTEKPNPLESLLEGVERRESESFERREAPRRVPGGSGDTAAPPELLRRLRPAHEPHDAIPSAAAIAGHPLHPTVVPIPIGAFVGALAADVAFAASRDPFFARAGRLLTATAVASGAVAGALGAVDFAARPRIRSHAAAWVHGGGNAIALGVGAASLALRARGAGKGAEGRTAAPAHLALSLVAGVLLLVTGWLGGELSYRHRVGVMDRDAEA